MSRLLIDTNVLIFFFNDTLDENTDALVRDYENQIFVSSVSVMEFMHLFQNGRITSKYKRQFDVMTFIEEHLGFKILYTKREHLKTLNTLPVVEGHNDPNDRMIIAQAISERMELVSSDTKFSSYIKYGLDYVKAKRVV